MASGRSSLPTDLPVSSGQVPRFNRREPGPYRHPGTGGDESKLSCEHERAGPAPSPTLSNKMSLSDTSSHHPITLIAALVARLGERGCRPQLFQWGEITIWLAQCPMEDPNSMASCGAVSVREGPDGKALVQNLCPHPLAEIICDLLGVFPDDRRVLGEAFRESRKNPRPNQGEATR